MHINAYQSATYLRLQHTRPGTTGTRSIAAVRLSDGACFVDDPLLYQELEGLHRGDPFAALFPDWAAKRRKDSTVPYPRKSCVAERIVNVDTVTVHAYGTHDYLRLAYTLPGESPWHQIAAVRLTDGRRFVDEPAIYEHLQANYAADPFRVLFPSSDSLLPYDESDSVPGDLSRGSERDSQSRDTDADCQPSDDVAEDDRADWEEEMQQEIEGWCADLEEAQGAEAYWQDSDYS